MVCGVGIEGSSVILLFGEHAAARSAAEPYAKRVFGAANDNGPREPVKTVTVRRKLEKSGVAIKIKVPVDEVVGVAVATAISEEGVLRSSIELVEWQNWGRKLRLPLFIKAGDGNLLPYSQQVDGVALGNSTARRKLVAEAGRRPRFLNRRKPGESAV